MAVLAINGGSPVRSKPFDPWVTYDELDKELLISVLESRNWGGIPFPNTYAKEFAQQFAARCGAEFAALVSNGTVGLEVALRALGIRAGDEVITTGFTWLATAAAPVYINAVPVFVDIDPRTYCLDAQLVEQAITPKTKAIIVVHLANQVADMDTIMAVAKKHGLAVIEDCAHAHFAEWNGQTVGTIGDIGVFSFQTSKIMTSGEGGLVMTNRLDLFQRCLSLINCGRKEPGYDQFEGQMLGWNYRITELQAALLLGQLRRIDELTERRKANIAYFYERLQAIEGITPLESDPRITRRQYYEILCRYDRSAFNGVEREKFLAAVLAEGVEIEGAAFYVTMTREPLFHVTSDDYPMIRERYGDRIGPDSAHLPECDRASYEEALWLHYELFSGERSDVDDVIAAIVKVKANLEELQ